MRELNIPARGLEQIAYFLKNVKVPYFIQVLRGTVSAFSHSVGFKFFRVQSLKIHYFIALNIPKQGKEYIFVSMPKNLAWTQLHNGLNVTITSKFVVYALADRAELIVMNELQMAP